MKHDPIHPKPFKRWHDQIPALRVAIDSMEKLPINNQIIIARAISSSAQEHKISQHGLLKQLSHDKILGLLKSEQKLRWYDQNHETYQAFKDFYSLDEPEFQVTAIKVILSVSYLNNNVIEVIGIDECVKFINEIFYLSYPKIIRIGEDLGIAVKKL